MIKSKKGSIFIWGINCMRRLIFIICTLFLLAAYAPVFAENAPEIPSTCLSKSENVTIKKQCLRQFFLFAGKPLHPLIIRELVTGIADREDQVVAINLDGSVGSNRYCCEGDFKVEKNDNRTALSIDLVKSRQISKDMCTDCWFLYRFEGTTANNVTLIRTWEKTGGTGVFSNLLFTRVEERRALRQKKPGELSFDKRQIHLEKLGEIPLGDRKDHTVSVEDNTLILDGKKISVPDY